MGAAGLWFLTTALSVHVAATLTGVVALNCAPPRVRALLGLRRPLRLSEALVGSNAAIGGPSTAAAFAGSMAPTLVVPAAVWGIVGYAGGTTLGVGVYELLRPRYSG